ncbi:hypothetical protein D9M71_596110 [compost metagenome]
MEAGRQRHHHAGLHLCREQGAAAAQRAVGVVQLRPGRQHLDQRPGRRTDHLQRRHGQFGRVDGWRAAGDQEHPGLAGLQRGVGGQRCVDPELRCPQLHRRVAAGQPVRFGRRARRGGVRARQDHRGLQRRPADHQHRAAAGRGAGRRCAGDRLGVPEQLQQVRGGTVPGPRYLQVRRLLRARLRRRLYRREEPLGFGDHAAQYVGRPGHPGRLR